MPIEPTDPKYPPTRDASRREYAAIRDSLIRSTPEATIAAVRLGFERMVGPVRRPSEASRDMGVWLPLFSIMAFAKALEDAEQQLARRERQATQRVPS